MANDILDAGNGIMVEVAAPTNGKAKKAATKKTPAKAAKKVTTKKTPAKKNRASDGTNRGVAKPANWKPEVKMGSYEDTGLRKPQVRILTVLAKAKGPFTRKMLAEKAAVEYAWLCNWIGQPDAAARKFREDRWGFTSLLTLKFVACRELEVDGRMTWVYEVTASGRKALEKHLAAEKAAK